VRIDRPRPQYPASARGDWSRRDFVRLSGGCAGYLATGLAAVSLKSRRAFGAQVRGEVVAESDFARIEKLSEGIWAVVSTPLKDGTTHFETTSNGGIVQGSQGLLHVEGYMSEEGAAWVAAHSERLTGERPTHVVVTHFHADHCRGLPGAVSTPQFVYATPTTRALMVAGEEPMLPAQTLNEEANGRIDLGGMTVHIAPRKGHTPSDVTVEIEEQQVVFCGDLVWNEMFPNFTHSIPSHMVRHCEELLGRPGVHYVPGHGAVGDARGLANYLGLLHDLEAAGRRAVEQGLTPLEATAAYTIPPALGEFLQFGGDYVERAFVAWDRELNGDE